MLVALLGYLARYSRRSLILAVEEPESFLHPRAQQELTQDGKAEFIRYVKGKMRKVHAAKFIEVLEDFRNKLRIA